MLPIALALAQFAPMIAGWLGGPKSADVASKVVGIAQAVTGTSSPDAALAAIQADPALAMQFQVKVVESHVELAQIAADLQKAEIAAATQNAGDINKTMQVEAAADHWPTYGWRPFIGFCFGLGFLITVCVTAAVFVAVMVGVAKPELLAQLPPFLTAMSVLLAVPMPILGIASWFRGKMQADPAVPADGRG